MRVNIRIQITPLLFICQGLQESYQLLQTKSLRLDENHKDRDAGRFSFFKLCAVCVQIEYHNMEVIDAVDKIVTIYGTT